MGTATPNSQCPRGDHRESTCNHERSHGTPGTCKGTWVITHVITCLIKYVHTVHLGRSLAIAGPVTQFKQKLFHIGLLTYCTTPNVESVTWALRPSHGHCDPSVPGDLAATRPRTGALEDKVIKYQQLYPSPTARARRRKPPHCSFLSWAPSWAVSGHARLC
jgi:hypothetical protein